ncbi:hypothetical protein RFI_34424 [Reticulomyxa filosa]|uniref:Uncharacterized protein n=1 Tax=Reticulomyxa filosa TaxID=46433 RepID=X6LNP8_RETFI|nr:hypothetical protein RFI_34424 [Reticulomyxa filosa]|eukprot:ETO02986.1 hypothetical protein RFI_34424 [Reticulomyxa filosa]
MTNEPEQTPSEVVQEYLRMAREITIDKENLDYLDHHTTFYICDMADNLQYWMIEVTTPFQQQFFKITYHIVPICLDTANHTTDTNIVGSGGSSNKGSHYKFFEALKKCNDIGRVPSWTRFFDRRCTNVQWKVVDEQDTVPTANYEDIPRIENSTGKG